ncbi:MAG: gamma-glutamyltransferase [Cytophagales bacterium]|nr:gamma-glutamyltransferase [Cytophagales bacterium]
MQYKFKISLFYKILISIFFILSCNEIKKETIYKKGMVSSAHPIASKVGLDILKNGGNAFDAAIGVHFALSVVYPNAGNIGGGGFAVYRLNDGEVGSLDFREKAPLKSYKDMYISNSDDGLTVVDKKSKIGHLASGVPGSVDGMVKLYEKFGSLDWKLLLEPSIEMAKNGFSLTHKQSNSLNRVMILFDSINDSEVSFVKEIKWKENDILVQKNLSKTLERIRDKKRDGFYSGLTADYIVNEMKKGDGIISYEDLNNYSSIWRKPIIGKYKDHKIISMAPPSSGGIALLQLLHGAEKLNVGNYEHNSLEYINTIAEIESRVYADRSTYLGDSDFYNVPIDDLIDNKYLDNRFSSIDPSTKTPSNQIKEGNIQFNESEETTHFSIVDEYGNAVSLTTTINGAYGSKVVVENAGFILNNEMDDFSVKPGYPNMFGLIGGEANSIEPNKRMLSSMTPTIIEKNDNLYMVLGTPGGSTIITSVFQTILNVIDFNMGMQEAVDAKKFHHQWLPDFLVVEKNTLNTNLNENLKKMGHKINERSSLGRMDCILIENGILEGGADKRGDNTALGY